MTDTLTIELTQDTLKLPVDLILKSINNEVAFSKEWITVIGMTLVAAITVLSQYFLTKKTSKSELKKIHTQIESDFSAKSRLDWVKGFRFLISDLLTTVDPDFRGVLDKKKMANLIFQS